MPFSFSHPALVLPLALLKPKRFSLTALAAGSMAPDFEYFLRFRIKSTLSHTWEGILLFDLPVALLIAFIFHGLVRNALIENLPLFFKRRLIVYTTYNWNKDFLSRPIVMVLSVLIGALSHLLWDLFTHWHSPLVQRVPFLLQDFSVLGIEIGVYGVLQHLSTLLGLFVLLVFVMTRPTRPCEPAEHALRYWGSVFFIASAIFTLRFLIHPTVHWAPDCIATGISAVLIAFAIAPFFTERKQP